MDSIVASLSDLVLLAQTYRDARECVPAVSSAVSSCPAMTFHPITAAFATQGYWIQADLLWMFRNTGLQLWATFFYVIAAVAGIIGMAMGAPPKMWVMFLIAPGIFHWLVEDITPAHGVRVNSGPTPANDPLRPLRTQREVWRLAETGLVSSPLNDRVESFQIFADRQPAGGPWGAGRVGVSTLFLHFDVLVSDIVEWLVQWTGVFRMAPNNVGGTSNIGMPGGNSGYTAQRAGQTEIDTDPSDDEHWLLQNLKWPTLLGITGAFFHSTDLRQAFVEFLANECGWALKKSIDEGRYVMASAARGGNIPDSIFVFDNEQLINPGTGVFGVGAPAGGAGTANDYGTVAENLALEAVPTPDSLQRFLQVDGPGSFRRSVNFISSPAFADRNILETVRCDQYLHILIHAIRWEAAHLTYQLLAGLPAGISPATMLYDLFYGWPIRDLSGGSSTPSTPAPPGSFGPGSLLDWVGLSQNDLTSAPPVQAGSLEQLRFLTNLVLVHMVRNEYLTAPKAYQPRVDSGRLMMDNAQTQMKTVGAFTKAGEYHLWGLLVPYVQGLLLTVFALAYPFCCAAIVVPGWHGVLFSWMKFWAWVKLWDVGFAATSLFERSLWAMIGNRSNAQFLFSKVRAMQVDNPVEWNCAAWLGSARQFPATTCSPEVVPQVYIGAGTPFSGGSAGGGVDDFVNFGQSLRLFDRAMAIGAAIDLDKSTGLYIQLMSMLNLAVPAVMAQVVLGAKAGAASLATNAMGAVATDAGRGAGSSYTARVSHRFQEGRAAAEREMTNAVRRKDPEGLVQQALDTGNAAVLNDLQASYNQAVDRALGQQSRIASNSAALSERAYSTAGQYMAGVGAAAFGQTAAAGEAAVGAISRIFPALRGNGGGGGGNQSLSQSPNNPAQGSGSSGNVRRPTRPRGSTAGAPDEYITEDPLYEAGPWSLMSQEAVPGGERRASAPAGGRPRPAPMGSGGGGGSTTQAQPQGGPAPRSSAINRALNGPTNVITSPVTGASLGLAQHTAASLIQSAPSMAAALLNYANALATATAQANYDAQQAEVGGAAAFSGMHGKVDQSVSSVLAEAADYKAAEGTYGIMNASFGVGAVSTLAAMGVSNASSVGKLPDNMRGAAFNGLLGPSARRASRFLHRNGGSIVNGLAEQYRASYGFEASYGKFDYGASLERAASEIVRELGLLPSGPIGNIAQVYLNGISPPTTLPTIEPQNLGPAPLGPISQLSSSAPAQPPAAGERGQRQ